MSSFSVFLKKSVAFTNTILFNEITRYGVDKKHKTKRVEQMIENFRAAAKKEVETRGIKLRKLAENTGISCSGLSSFFNSKGGLGNEKISSLATALGLKIEITRSSAVGQNKLLLQQLEITRRSIENQFDAMRDQIIANSGADNNRPDERTTAEMLDDWNRGC